MEPHEEVEAMIGKVARVSSQRDGHLDMAAGKILGYIETKDAMSIRFEGYNFQVDPGDFTLEELVLVTK